MSAQSAGYIIWLNKTHTLALHPETYLSPRDAPGRGGDDTIRSDEYVDMEEPGDAAAAVHGGALNLS